MDLSIEVLREYSETMIKYILIAVAVVVIGGISGVRYHEDQLNKLAVKNATKNACELANQAQQQKDDAEVKATNGRFHGPPLPSC